MIEKILNIYREYDKGNISDKDALYKISDIFLKEHPIMNNKVEKVYKLYDSGNIDSGDALMRTMNIIEKIYPEMNNY